MSRVAGNEPSLRIIAVGDELLEGRTADTNSRRIQRALGRHVVQAAGVAVVPDRAGEIAAALDRTLPGDLVVLCGGLGSTPDDLTRDAVAGWAGVEMPEDPAVRSELEERLQRRGIPIKAGVYLQCRVPVGLHPLGNPVGSAPGLVGTLSERTVVLLPGVPAELAGLLPLVVAWLEERGLLPAARPIRLWRTAQAPELAVVRRCDPARQDHPDLEWAFWLTRWGVDMRVMAGLRDDPATLDAAAAKVDEALGPLVFARGMIALPEVVQRGMLDRGRTLSVAESCTGGLLGGALTDASGSSGFFRGGVISYANEVKRDRLGVAQVDLDRHGAVSEPVVRAMAAGCRRLLETDYSLAVSGISGPDGGSEGKPVGTTWIAIATPEAEFARCYRFGADRERNRALTVAVAIDTLRRTLAGGDAVSPFLPGDYWKTGR